MVPSSPQFGLWYRESTGGIDSPVDCVDDCCIGLSSRGEEPQNVEKEAADTEHDDKAEETRVAEPPMPIYGRRSRRRSPRQPVVYNGCSNDCGCDHPAADEARSNKNAPSELVTGVAPLGISSSDSTICALIAV